MPQMTAAQDVAFSAANTGQSFNAANAEFLFVGMATVALLTWWAWLTVQVYQSLTGSDMNMSDAVFKIGRAGFLVIIVIAVMTF